MSTPEEPEALAQDSAQDETPETEAASTEAANAEAADAEAADDVSAEAADEEAEAEPKPKPARRRAAPKVSAPAAPEAAADETAAPDAAAEDAAAEVTADEETSAEETTDDDSDLDTSPEETAAEDAEPEEAPAKAPARRTTRKQPAAKPKRAPAVAAHSVVDADLPADIFDVQVNVPLIHQVVVAQQAAARQGTHSTKTRGDVRGGGRKPYRQKGTGRARQGSIRAPQFAGGGVVHGPVPRSYAQKTPKKMKAAALRGALSDRARHGLIQVVDGFVDGAEPKTRDALAVLNLTTEGNSAGQGGRLTGTPLRGHNVLVVAERSDEATWKSLRNAVGVHLIDPGQLNTYDVLVSDRVVFTTSALAAFISRASAAGGSGGSSSLDTDTARADPRGRNAVNKIFNHRDVLLRPVISEKSYGLQDEFNKYTFIVAPHANKTQVRQAVEAIFNVKVIGVNTLNRPGKRRRTRYGWGKRPDTKRAIVSLAAGDRIDIGGLGS